MKPMLIILVSFILHGCIDLTLSDEAAAKKLAGISTEICFSNHEIDGKNIHYVYSDQGKDVLTVFIHGSPGSWSAFIDFFRADTLLNVSDVISIDRPGFGQSNYGYAEPSLERQAYFIHEAIQLFTHKRKILVGHSLGGPVIARLVMDYPDAYAGLVFVAASIDPAMEKDEWYRALIKTSIGSYLTPKDFIVSNEEILPLKRELEKMLPLWNCIRIPSILIHGTRDSLVPVENVAFAEDMLVDSLTTVELLDGVDHFIPWTHPEKINEAIHQLAIAPSIYP